MRRNDTATFHLKVNGHKRELVSQPDKPLLWVLRDDFKLFGAKYGCGAGQCGSCLVHVDDVLTPSCVFPISAVGNRPVTTIEGLSPDGDHPVQKAWLRRDVVQCGYCQPGQIMAAAALLKKKAAPTDEEITETMSKVLCRCGTYPRVKDAIRYATQLIQAQQKT